MVSSLTMQRAEPGRCLCTETGATDIPPSQIGPEIKSELKGIPQMWGPFSVHRVEFATSLWTGEIEAVLGVGVAVTGWAALSNVVAWSGPAVPPSTCPPHVLSPSPPVPAHLFPMSPYLCVAAQQQPLLLQ